MKRNRDLEIKYFISEIKHVWPVTKRTYIAEKGKSSMVEQNFPKKLQGEVTSKQKNYSTSIIFLYTTMAEKKTTKQYF